MSVKARHHKFTKIDGIDQIKLEHLRQSVVKSIINQEEEIFTIALRTMTEPPIKGEITKGKLKWRGIRLIRQHIGLDSYSWLEQRGKQISPKFHISHNKLMIDDSRLSYHILKTEKQ